MVLLSVFFFKENCMCLLDLGSSWGFDPYHRTGNDGQHGHFHGEVASYWPDD